MSSCSVEASNCEQRTGYFTLLTLLIIILKCKKRAERIEDVCFWTCFSDCVDDNRDSGGVHWTNDAYHRNVHTQTVFH